MKSVKKGKQWYEIDLALLCTMLTNGLSHTIKNSWTSQNVLRIFVCCSTLLIKDLTFNAFWVDMTHKSLKKSSVLFLNDICCFISNWLVFHALAKQPLRLELHQLARYKASVPIKWKPVDWFEPKSIEWFLYDWEIDLKWVKPIKLPSSALSPFLKKHYRNKLFLQFFRRCEKANFLKQTET